MVALTEMVFNTLKKCLLTKLSKEAGICLSPLIIQLMFSKLTSTNFFTCFIWLFLILSLSTEGSAFGQNFQLMRYDENYSNLKTDTALNFYNHIKFIPLSANGNDFLSIGGEARQEFDAFDNEDWGKVDAGHDNFYLQRYDLHTDWEFGNDFRIFFQLRSALENGRPMGPRPIDEDQLNVQNLFADLKIWRSSKDSLIIRAGRQELNYGAGRLISVREGPNVRLYFTGLKAIYKYQNLSVDAFAMEADQVKPGVFDNQMTKQVNLWGFYSTLNLEGNKNVDFYYIGNRKDSVVYNEGTGNEVRHTIGGRLWKNNNGFVYDIEAAYQFGKFSGQSISAWTASFDLGYIFADLKSRPAFGLRNDYISGGGNKSGGDLETFNPIYPKGGYFGFDPQIGPVNLIDIHPYASIQVCPGLTFLADIVYNWRYSVNDGIYRPSGAFNLTGDGTTQKYIGTDYLAKVSYVFNAFLSVDFGLQYFKTGPYINAEIPNHKNAVETNSRISFKF